MGQMMEQAGETAVRATPPALGPLSLKAKSAGAPGRCRVRKSWSQMHRALSVLMEHSQIPLP